LRRVAEHIPRDSEVKRRPQWYPDTSERVTESFIVQIMVSLIGRDPN